MKIQFLKINDFLISLDNIISVELGSNSVVICSTDTDRQFFRDEANALAVYFSGNFIVEDATESSFLTNEKESRLFGYDNHLTGVRTIIALPHLAPSEASSSFLQEVAELFREVDKWSPRRRAALIKLVHKDVSLINSIFDQAEAAQ